MFHYEIDIPQGGTVERSPSTGFFTINPFNNLGDDRAMALMQLGSNQDNIPTLFCGQTLIEAKGAVVASFVGKNADHPNVDKVAREKARTFGVVNVAVGLCKVGDVVVWERVAKYEAIDEEEVFDRLIDRMEALHSIVSGECEEAVDIFKAKKKKFNPFTQTGYKAMVNHLRGQLATISDPLDRSQWSTILKATAGNGWIDDERKRAKVFAAIREAMPDRRIIKKQLPMFEEIYSGSATTMFEGVKQNILAEQGVKVGLDLDLADEAAIQAVTQQHTLYVRTSMGNRAKAMSARAQSIVQHGMELGLGRDEIAEQLRGKLKNSYENQRRGYLNLVAATFMNRSRSRSLAGSYQEARIDYVEIVAMLDDATTEICRALDGKEIPVGNSIQIMADVDNLKDPENVKWVNPWIRQNKEGLSIPQKNGQSVPFASKDSQGNMALKVDPKNFHQFGIGFPPYHGNCRTTTIPSSRTFQVSVPTKPIEEEPPPQPKGVPQAPKMAAQVGTFQVQGITKDRPYGDFIESSDERFA